nr:C-type lectin domain-containing receptor 8 [Arenicola marina]
MAARVVAYKPPTVSQCAEEENVYEMPVPPPTPITPKPAPGDRKRQRLLVTAIIGVFLVAGCLLGLLAGCLLGLLAAIVIRIPASGGRQEAVDGELVRSPIECPAVACPSVPCPELAYPSVPCPELACPSVPCHQLTCPNIDISCPAISCPTMSPVTSCHDGFVRRDGSNSCYKVINVAKTRPEAAAECARHGAYLVEIGSQEEQTFIEGHTGGNFFWIGGIRLPPPSSATFIWEHSKQIIAEGVTFTSWGPRQPNIGDENYTIIGYGDSTQWHDVGITFRAKVLCEKSLL